MKRSIYLAAALASAAVATPAFAAVDGTAEAAYGAAIKIQTLQTNFGNATSGNPLTAGGSELDAVYARIADGKLYLVFAGNLESNFNHLELFFDTAAGGQNQLRNDNADVDFNGLNKMAGLKFDASFAADHFISIGGGGSPYQLFANYAPMLTAGGGSGTFVGGSAGGSGVITGDLGINIAINNSNTGGVDGGTGPSSGAGVTTGVEYEIPLSLLGNPVGDFSIVAFINGSGHDFLSNQILGSLPDGTGNLGGPGAVDFSAIAGDQFFTVPNPVPEPAAAGLLTPALLLLARRRTISRGAPFKPS